MLSNEGLAFLHRMLFLVSKLKLHPFTLRNGLLVNAETKRTCLIGWTSVLLNSLYVPLVIGRIKEAEKIEGIIHFFLPTIAGGTMAFKMIILANHSELVQVVNNVVQLCREIGETNLHLFFTRMHNVIYIIIYNTNINHLMINIYAR